MVGAGAVVGIAIVAVLLVSRQQDALALPSGSELANIEKATSGVSADTFDAVGTGGLANPIKPMSSSEVLGGADGKPELLYIGAEFCSTCAAERWSLVIALSRFGEFQNLQPSESVAGENYPPFPTFTFYRAQYTSQYLDFVAVETGNRSKQPLQKLSQAQQSLLTLYDHAGTIPFVDFGNRYYAVGSGYDMHLLADRTWEDVASALTDPSSPLTKAVVGNANYIAAGICQLTQNEPSSVCSSPAVSSISSTLGA